METILTVEGMSCNHCKAAVTNAVTEIAGVQSVEVDLEKKKVTVQHKEDVTVANVVEVIEEQGYDVVQ